MSRGKRSFWGGKSPPQYVCSFLSSISLAFLVFSMYYYVLRNFWTNVSNTWCPINFGMLRGRYYWARLCDTFLVSRGDTVIVQVDYLILAHGIGWWIKFLMWAFWWNKLNSFQREWKDCENILSKSDFSGYFVLIDSSIYNFK